MRELANLKELVDNLDRKRQSVWDFFLILKRFKILSHEKKFDFYLKNPFEEDRALPGLPRSAPTYSLTPDDPNDPREPPVTRSEIKSEIQAAFKVLVSYKKSLTLKSVRS